MDCGGGETQQGRELETLKGGEGSTSRSGKPGGNAAHRVTYLLLDVVVAQGAAVLKLLTREDEALLVGGDALLVLDLLLDVVDGVGGLDVEGDGLSGEGLDEDLHSAAKAEDKVKGGLWGR